MTSRPARALALLATIAALTAIAAVGLVSAPSVANAQLDQRLSNADRDRLGQGRLIVRSTTERRGPLHLIGGTSFQVVDQPPAVVWRALHDAGNLGAMLPGLTTSRQTSHQGTRRGVHVRHGQGAVSAEYGLRLNYIEASRVLMFEVDSSRESALRAGWGFMKVQSWGEGKTLLSFGILADVGTGMLSGALRPKIHEWMLQVPSTIKRYLEGEGRSRYGVS